MMYIHVADQTYELKTTLGVTKKLEMNFKMSLNEIMKELGMAKTSEMMDIIAIAADKKGDKEFENIIFNEWDYYDLLGVLQELLARLMFGGTPEQQEEKINKAQMDEETKNSIRAALGLPIPKPKEQDADSQE